MIQYDTSVWLLALIAVATLLLQDDSGFMLASVAAASPIDTTDISPD